MSSAPGVTAGGPAIGKPPSQGSQQYALLSNKSNIPRPNALAPHKQASGTGSNFAAGLNRRMSHQSGTGSAGGAGFGLPGSNSGLRGGSKGGMLAAAGASTISNTKLPNSKQASKQGFFPGQALTPGGGGLMATNTALGRLPTLGLN